MLALGATGLLLIGLIVSFSGYDDFSGGEYFVDQSRVERAVDQPCVAMKDAASELVLIGKPEEAVASLKAFTATIGQLVAAIEGAKPNPDAKAWRNDLVKLAASLDGYAAKVATGDSGPYTLPRTSSGYVTERMFNGSPDGCEVPTRIDMLDPKAAEDYDSF